MTDNTALLIIDVQIGMFAEDLHLYHGAELIATLQPLIKRARTAGVPVIYVQHEDQNENEPLWPAGPGFAVHPALQPAPGDLIIHKRNPNSFQDTPLQTELERLGVKRLVIAGLQTEFCVDTTCRRAFSLGYAVTLVQDGHSTYDTDLLSAEQIIAHHNQNLAGWFVALKPAAEIAFTE